MPCLLSLVKNPPFFQVTGYIWIWFVALLAPPSNKLNSFFISYPVHRHSGLISLIWALSRELKCSLCEQFPRDWWAELCRSEQSSGDRRKVGLQCIKLWLQSSCKQSSVLEEGPIEVVFLTFVWDKTASGTTRINTDGRLPSWFAPPFIVGRDCIWNSKDQHFGDKSPPVPGDLHRDKLNKWIISQSYSIHCSTCIFLCPLEQEGLVYQHCTPFCFIGSLVL